ncbi:MAG: histidine--tRNA ligase [Candidatus Omnitrophica bacterium]|nr:histidine--tRNA ligase [Candidatus Omnitrophota bacterium]
MSLNKTFALPRGTADILPEESFLWEEIESKARRICQSYGFREIRTPLYEDVNLFKRSLGQTSDVVNKQLLELASHKDDEGYALRPEGTASIVRSYLENSFDKKEALSKFFYMGPMFRGERPQRGRLRQFHQIGAEAIGPGSLSAFLDAEIISLAMFLLESFGVKKAKLKINSLGSKEDKERISLWLREVFAADKALLCPDCQNRFERNVFRVLDCKNETCKGLVSRIVTKLPLSDEGTRYFECVQEALRMAGIDFEIAPHLVRGLDYYSHTVFEITAQGLGSQDAIGAGGRYSQLIHELGGNLKVDFGAIGFALGIERVLLAVQSSLNDPGFIDAYVVILNKGEAFLKEAFKVSDYLRKAGFKVDLSYLERPVKSQFSQASKLNARFALIIGEDELASGKISVKNMKTSEQELVDRGAVLDYLKKIASLRSQ